MDDFIFIPYLHLYFTLYYFNLNKEREIFSGFNLNCLLVESISSRLEMFIQCKSSDILHQHPSIALNKKIHFINFLRQVREMLLWHSKCIYTIPLEKKMSGANLGARYCQFYVLVMPPVWQHFQFWQIWLK